MVVRELIQHLEQTFGGAVVSASEAHAFPHVVVRLDSLKAVLSFCVHDPKMRFDFLECLTGVDTGQDLAVVYQLFSTRLSHTIGIKVFVDRHAAAVPTATGFWRAATAYEREAAEMLGLRFEGHPMTGHLLLPDDWQGHPLRKDYVFAEDYQGVEHRRPPLRKEHERP